MRLATPNVAKFSRARRAWTGSNSIVSMLAPLAPWAKAERAAELEHALGCNGGGNHTEDGTVLERIGATTMLGAVPQGLRAHLGERVRRFFRGHACSSRAIPPRQGRVAA